MKTLLSYFRCSLNEFKKTKSIVLMAMLAAMSIVVSSFKIRVSPHLNIGISTIINQLAYSIIGPVSGAFYGAALNIFKAIVMPTGPFNILYTISPVVAGFIFGSFYYKKEITLMRSFAANFVVKLVCNIIITTTIMVLLQGKAVNVILPVRAVKNLIQWPVDSLLFYWFAKSVSGIRKNYI